MSWEKSKQGCPGIAPFSMKLAPQWRKRKAPPRQTYLARYLGRAHTEGRPQKGRLCGASKPATHAPGEAKKRQCAATMPRNGPQNGTLYSDRVFLERRKANSRRPCSSGRTCTCLCAALKSMLAPKGTWSVLRLRGQRQVRCHGALVDGIWHSLGTRRCPGQGAALSLLQKRHLICLRQCLQAFPSLGDAKAGFYNPVVGNFIAQQALHGFWFVLGHLPVALTDLQIRQSDTSGMHWEKSATQQCSCASPVPAIRTNCTHSTAIFFLSNQPSKHALRKHMDRDRLQDVLTEARVPEGLQDLVLARGFDCPSDFAFAFPTIAELQPFIVSARDFRTANNIEDPESSVAAARLRKALAECHRLSLRSRSPCIQPNQIASWAERLPPKLTSERVSSLVETFKSDYPGELLDADTWPWQYRLSSQQYQERMEAKSARAVRSELKLLSQAFFDDTPAPLAVSGVAHLHPDRVSQRPGPVPSSAPVEPQGLRQEDSRPMSHTARS